jgi:hypothetical protein
MPVPTRTVPVADPLGFFPGVWSIERDVHDALAGQDGRYTGTATFRPDGAGLSWVERGTLRIGAFEGLATRTMAIVPVPAAGDARVADGHGPERGGGAVRGRDTAAQRGRPARWQVEFDDGRPFHPLDLSGGACPVDHPCGPDHYAGWVRVEAEDLLVVSWRVVGPAKDHTILSRYTR